MIGKIAKKVDAPAARAEVGRRGFTQDPRETGDSESSRHQQTHWLCARSPRESVLEKTSKERNPGNER